MLALVALGTIGFWVLLFIIFVIITALVETEHGLFSAGVIVSTMLMFEYSYHLHLFAGFAAHPGKVLIYIVGYLAIAAVWGIAKWYSFVQGQMNAYNDYKYEFMKLHRVKVLTPMLAKQLLENGARQYPAILPQAPVARKYKSNIIRWMTYWPFSILGTLFNDLIRKVFDHIYKYLLSVYEVISNHVFRGAKADADLANQVVKD